MYKISSKKYDCPFFIEDDLSLLLFPCFFSHYLIKQGTIFSVSENVSEEGVVTSEMIEKNIDATTINIILNRLDTFIQWVEKYAKESKHVFLSTHHNLPDDLINHYLNDVLINERGAGENSIYQHIMALNAYYNYLSHAGFTTVKKLFIYPKNKTKARNNKQARTAVKYLTPELRSILYQNTNSIRDELILKMAGELGLRSKENLGLLVNDFNVGRKKYPGMLSLFAMMESNPDMVEFEYYLQGKFTKSKRFSGGESRMLYIHRALLERMKKYFDDERLKSNENTFFVNESTTEVGTAISESRGSKIFKQTKNIVLEKQNKGLLPSDGQLLEDDHTYHILRHSFGTDKFYEFAKENNIAIDDVVPTSQVYLAVAKLLGHSAADNSAPKTTKTYIRSCNIKACFQMVA